MNKKDLLRAAAIVIAVLLAVYAGAGWGFSGMILEGPGGGRGGGGRDGGPGGGGPPRDGGRQQAAESNGLPEPEPFTFTSVDDVTLHGSYYANPNGTSSAVILLPGGDGLGRNALRMAPLYWEMGCDVVIFDFRGAGENDGYYRTYGYHEKHDVSAAVDWLENEQGLEPGEVGLVGGSYGAGVGLQTLMVRSDLAFVLADSPYSSLHAAVSEHGTRIVGGWVKPFIPSALFFAGVRANMKPREASPALAVAQTETPILLFHGVEDEVTSVEHSDAIYAQANPDTTVFHRTEWGPGHVRSMFNDYDRYRELVHEFLDIYAPEFGERPPAEASP